MLSGVGDKEHLTQVGIQPKIDLPVGKNLQDHITTGFDLVLINETLELGIGQMLNPLSMWNYFTKGTGPWTTTGCELMAFFNTKNTSGQPDLQFMVMPLSIREDDGVFLRKLVGISDKTFSDYFARNRKPSITILPVVLHPKSRGFLRLHSKDPAEPPLIDPKYLSAPEDVDTLILGIQLIKQLVDTPQMKLIGAELNRTPFPGCEHHTFDTRAYWECYVTRLTITSYHPVGTCKMGHPSDVSTVVDFDFKVQRTNNLYVVDGSVLPTLTSGNINGAILMLAEMASDVIRKSYFLNTGYCRMSDLFLL
ncbi:hypothetical protein GWI33_013617 [Rhynchophorus ferrugineus]|uniref:Glucose-methanol-choline oxidoreductase C-terminal domain-containing protein n=1 Tax=Rhynchophorus ferrugineus TaxID=354439 RepID=A0A834I940_RHYFE|nr:hypothetical protein GWI33_013617 [Rhynchophorus ferrugineus]